MSDKSKRKAYYAEKNEKRNKRRQEVRQTGTNIVFEKNIKKRKPKYIGGSTAQSTVKYVGMAENGMCYLGDGIYSKSIIFNDINYAMIARGDKVNVFSLWCDFINSFSPKTQIQISSINTYFDKESFKENMLLSLTGDKNDKYRKEYNQMLYDKALQGQNSIIRKKILTFSAQADNYEEASAVLGRLEIEIKSKFKALNCPNHTMTGIERLCVINDCLKPQEKLNFNYKELLGANYSTKEAVCPYLFDFEPCDANGSLSNKFYRFGDNYGQVFCIKITASDMQDEFLNKLTMLPCNLAVNFYAKSYEQKEAYDIVKKQIAFMQKEYLDETAKMQKQGYSVGIVGTELQYAYEEAQQLLENMQQNNQKLFDVCLLVQTSAPTVEKLKDNCMSIETIVREHNCSLVPLACQQEQGMNSSLPLGRNFIEIHRTLTSASAGIFIPFTTQELYQSNGMYYGVNTSSGNMIMFNRSTLQNYNGVVLGTSGSGKSFATKREIINYLLNTKAEVIILDPEREYTVLAESFGGEIIKLSASSKNYINPMEINENYSDTDEPVKMKCDFIASLLETMSNNRNMRSGDVGAVIDRAALSVYRDYFLNRTKKMPTLNDLYKALKKQPEPVAQNLALTLERYVSGSLDVFNNQTNINTDNRFIVFDTYELGKQLKDLAMLIVLDHIWNRVTRNRELGIPTMIFIDEIHLFFKSEGTQNFLLELWKRGRKFNCSCTGITQNMADMVKSEEARSMLSNSEFTVLLNQKGDDKADIQEIYGISDEQLSYITNAPRGSGLLLAGGAIVPFTDNFPENTELYRIMSTNPKDLQKKKEA